MTRYIVTAEGDPESPMATADFDEALDWFTNACTEVMAEDGNLESASISRDGVLHGQIYRNPPSVDTDEFINLRKVA